MMGKIGERGRENYPKLAVKPSFLQDAEALRQSWNENLSDVGGSAIFRLTYDEPNEPYDSLHQLTR
jgi:hypothetical protein